jgi:hypothetical protein
MFVCLFVCARDGDGLSRQDAIDLFLGNFVIDPVADAVHVPAPAVGAEFFVQVRICGCRRSRCWYRYMRMSMGMCVLTCYCL